MAQFPVRQMRRSPRRGLLRMLAAGALFGVAPLLTACPEQAMPAAVIRVDALGFVPGALVVPPGTTVIWRNYTPNVQTITCDPASAARPGLMALPAGAGAWDSGDLHAGDTFAHTFTTPGTYVYASRRDADGRFAGSITVRP